MSSLRLPSADGVEDPLPVGVPASAPSRRYFPQLDGLRFVAALLVIVHHLPLAPDFRPDAIERDLLIKLNLFGWVGVDIFLVLSSYLIVSLLLEERRRTGQISVARFYVRRILRIWPLYFAYLPFAFFLLPAWLAPGIPIGPAVAQHLLPMLTFTGNLSYIVFPGSLFSFFAHLWTISLEEQFYVIAPMLGLLAATLRRHAWKIAMLAVAFSFAARWYVLSNAVPYPVVWVFTLCRLDPFVVGTCCAALLYVRPQLARYRLGWLFAFTGIAMLWFVMQFPRIGTSLHTSWQLTMVALGAGSLVLGALLPWGIARLLSGPALPFLGKISFGIYVYHILGIALVTRYGPMLLDTAGDARTLWWLRLAMTLALTIATAAVSYLLWERPFLRLKTRYESIPSRPP